MSEHQDDRYLMDHEYDGIQEYDNPLPGWWKWTFIGSMVFAVFYGVYWHLGGPGLSDRQEYEAELATYFAEQSKRGGGLKVSEQMLAGLAQNAALVGATKSLFVAKCAQCHGKLGEGGIGPNLTDDHYIHGHSLMQTFTVIDRGVPAKGMLAWGKQLKPGEIANLTAYVASLLGTKPPKPKPPQGKQVQR